MREHLYRGIRKDNGEWTYGFYVECINPADGSKLYEIFESPYRRNVLPETVGAFTGHYDKNDVMIFEHSIVRIMDKHIGVIGWDKHDATWIVWTNTIQSCRYADLGSYNDGKYLEVIGNITDNPELLEGD